MIAICVGHSRPGDGGAVSAGDVSEHAYNSALAILVQAALEARGLQAFVINQYQGRRYGAAMTWLARHLSDRGAKLAVELHFNFSDVRAASGHEWLYYEGSAAGRMVARALDNQMHRRFPNALARGVKSRSSHDDGGGFLRRTPCPAVICEPFFGSNESDWETFDSQRCALADVIAAGLADAWENLYGKARLA